MLRVKARWRKDSMLLLRSWMCCRTGRRNLCSGDRQMVPDGDEALVDAEKPLPEATQQMPTEPKSGIGSRPLLCLGNLNRRHTDFDIVEMFGNRVRLRDVYVQRDDLGNKTGYAFVRCESLKTAEELIQYFKETPVSHRARRLRKRMQVIIHTERGIVQPSSETEHHVLKLFNVPPTENVQKVTRLFERNHSISVLGRREQSEDGMWRHVVYVSLPDVDQLMEARSSLDRAYFAKRKIFARNVWEKDPPITNEEIQFSKRLQQPRDYTTELQDTLEKILGLQRTREYTPEMQGTLEKILNLRKPKRRERPERERPERKRRERKRNAEGKHAALAPAERDLLGAAGEAREQEHNESPEPVEQGCNTSAKPAEQGGYESREPVEQERNEGPEKYDAGNTVL